MNHDFTMTALASRSVARAQPPDVRELRDHVGDREAYAIRVRRSLSGGLYRLAEQVDPRPARTERDELFDAISALLTEQHCEAPGLKIASQRGC